MGRPLWVDAQTGGSPEPASPPGRPDPEKIIAHCRFDTANRQNRNLQFQLCAVQCSPVSAGMRSRPALALRDLLPGWAN
jgi:hypothetical protein